MSRFNEAGRSIPNQQRPLRQHQNAPARFSCTPGRAEKQLRQLCLLTADDFGIVCRRREGGGECETVLVYTDTSLLLFLFFKDATLTVTDEDEQGSPEARQRLHMLPVPASDSPRVN